MDFLKQSSSTREDLGMLSVLDALERKERVTQRELASVTGLNLRKVNFCLHKLLEKGHVKFQRVRDNPDKRAYLYILTPSGLRAKSLLTYNFLKFTLDFYSRMEGKLRACLNEMRKTGKTRVLLYGTSDIVRILIQVAEGTDCVILGVVDDACDQDAYEGLRVLGLSQVSALGWDCVLITQLDDIEESERQLLGAGIASDKIWRLS